MSHSTKIGFVLACVALLAIGVYLGRNHGPKRVLPTDIDAKASGYKAMELFDTDKDGTLSTAELERCPSLKVAMEQVDPTGDGITAEKITERIRQWQESRLGKMPLRCSVMHNGEPMAGVDVKFVPEKFLVPYEAQKEATGKTDESGNAILTVALPTPNDLPGAHPGFYRVEITCPGVAIPPQYNVQTILGQEVALDANWIETGIRFDVNY